MVDIQKEINELNQKRKEKEMNKPENIEQAVKYCFDNPRLSMHHVAVKFNVTDSVLQAEYKKAWYESKKVHA